METDDFEEFIENFRENLRFFRDRRGLTQAQVAEMVDRSEKAIGHYEQGLYRPSYEVLFRMSKAYRIEFAQFFSTGEPQRAGAIEPEPS